MDEHTEHLAREQAQENAERWVWWRDHAREQLLRPERAGDEVLPDLRTHWVGPVLMCSGPVGGYMTPDEAIDAARKEKR